MENDLTPAEIVFLQECNLYQCAWGLQILTENDEGSMLDKDDITRLAEIFTKYAKTLT